MKRLRNWLHYLVPLAVLALALGVRVLVPAVEEVQLKIFDTFQRIKPRTYEPTPVKFVDLDDESLERIGQWPWPRTYVADMTARLANMGAADKLPDHDRVLGEVFAQANVVTGFVLTNTGSDRLPVTKGTFAFAGDDPKPFVPAFRGAIVNLPPLQEAASGNGSFNLVPETDGIVRRVPLLFTIGDTLYPSLVTEALRVAQGARTNIVKSSGASGETAYGEQTGVNHIKIGAIEVPTDGAGRIWLHDTGSIPERRIPAWRLFSDDFDPAEIEGQIVFVGTSAAGLFDLRTTPLAPVIPGVEIHIQAVEQILLGHFLERPDWATGVEIVYLLALGLVLIFLIPRFGAFWVAILGGVSVAAVVGGSWFLYAERLWLLDPVLPSVSALAIYLVGSLINFLKTEAERRQVRGAFSRYMSPALVEQLARNPDRLVLDGELRDMTLLFADIRGFTTISEQFKGDPKGLTKLINQFLTPMTNMILERSGTIDKHMGDCIMAFWNAPLDDEEHAANACDSALAMFTALEEVNSNIKADCEADGRDYHRLNIGIGLNSGPVYVGNMGSEQRFDYSVLGDAVNLAARLEGQSKNYGVGIVIGETSTRAADYAVLELDLIAVKGKKEGGAHFFSARRQGAQGRPGVPEPRRPSRRHAGCGSGMENPSH